MKQSGSYVHNKYGTVVDERIPLCFQRDIKSVTVPEREEKRGDVTERLMNLMEMFSFTNILGIF